MLSDAQRAQIAEEERELFRSLGIPGRRIDALLGGRTVRTEAGPGLDEPAPEAPKLKTLADGAAKAVAELAQYEAGEFSDRVQTGLRRLDRRLRGGLHGGQLTLLGAPSGGGKTSLAQQVAAEAACAGPVLFVSPEMGCAELAEREIIRRSGRPLWDRNPWKSAGDGARDYARMAHESAADGMIEQALPFYVLDRDCTMAEVEAAAHSIPGIRLVVVDYAQQVATMDDRTPRYLAVGEIGTRSVILAQALNVPVLVASQVNVAKDGNTKAFSFRETAILEHKAHVVLILDVRWTDGEVRTVESAEIVCTKQRSGQAFRLPVHYEPELYRITDVQPERGMGALPELPW
jgi:replicative DNA helicase